jgi:hypothetical protein
MHYCSRCCSLEAQSKPRQQFVRPAAAWHALCCQQQLSLDSMTMPPSMPDPSGKEAARSYLVQDALSVSLQELKELPTLRRLHGHSTAAHRQACNVRKPIILLHA